MQNTNSIFAYLPQKKFTYVLLGVLIAVGGFFYYLEKRGGEERVAAGGVRVAAAEQFQIDTDDDGLKDWEEILLGSDPDNPDTDGDGTRDGQEVKEGRSPLVKGPSDKYSDEQEEKFTARRKEGATELDAIFLNMFAAATTLQKNDQIYTGTSSLLYDIAEREVARYGSKLVSLNIYSIGDIRVREESSPSSLRAYGNAVGEMSRKYDVPPGTEPDLLIIYKALLNSDERELEELDSYIIFYDKFVPAILSIPVPKVLAAAHLDFVNAMNAYGSVLRSVRTVFRDPFAAATGMKQIEAVFGALSAARSEMDALMKKNGVIFAEDELGAIFGPVPEDVANGIRNYYIRSGIPITTPPAGNRPTNLNINAP